MARLATCTQTHTHTTPHLCAYTTSSVCMHSLACGWLEASARVWPPPAKAYTSTAAHDRCAAI